MKNEKCAAQQNATVHLLFHGHCIFSMNAMQGGSPCVKRDASSTLYDPKITLDYNTSPECEFLRETFDASNTNVHSLYKHDMYAHIDAQRMGKLIETAVIDCLRVMHSTGDLPWCSGVLPPSVAKDRTSYNARMDANVMVKPNFLSADGYIVTNTVDATDPPVDGASPCMIPIQIKHRTLTKWRRDRDLYCVFIVNGFSKSTPEYEECALAWMVLSSPGTPQQIHIMQRPYANFPLKERSPWFMGGYVDECTPTDAFEAALERARQRGWKDLIVLPMSRVWERVEIAKDAKGLIEFTNTPGAGCDIVRATALETFVQCFAADIYNLAMRCKDGDPCVLQHVAFDRNGAPERRSNGFIRKPGKYGCDFGIVSSVAAANEVCRLLDDMTDDDAMVKCEAAFNIFTRAGGLRVEVKTAKLMWHKKKRKWHLQFKQIKPALFDILVLVGYFPDRLRVWAVNNVKGMLIGDAGWFSPSVLDRKLGVMVEVNAPCGMQCPVDALESITTKIRCRSRCAKSRRIRAMHRDKLMHGESSGLVLGDGPIADVLF